ncbi:MAG: hypothetical protein GY950_16415 [bacterium]|nr:hypothetical protein [bacterium]
MKILKFSTAVEKLGSGHFAFCVARLSISVSQLFLQALLGEDVAMQHASTVSHFRTPTLYRLQLAYHPKNMVLYLRFVVFHQLITDQYRQTIIQDR